MKKELIHKCTCLRCGNKWFPKSSKLPKTCSKCRSPYWAIPRKNKEFMKIFKEVLRKKLIDINEEIPPMDTPEFHLMALRIGCVFMKYAFDNLSKPDFIKLIEENNLNIKEDSSYENKS